MKKLLLALIIAACPALAGLAQGQAVQQSGSVTPGHVGTWITNGVLGDGGAPGGFAFTGPTTLNDFTCVGASGTIIDCGLSATSTNNWPAQQNFNGGATAPTRAPGDSTINVATTAFVAGSLNAQTTNYSLASTDCGNTVTLGGSTFFTLTVGAASGFPAACSILISNIDTGRGKKMAVSGINVGQGNILWPGQSFWLKNESNTWTVVGLPTRWVLAGTTAFFVDGSLGNDANDGLASGAGAFASIGKAIIQVCSALDLNENNVTITTTAATYSEHLILCNFLGYTGANGYSQVTVIMTGATLSAAGGSGIGIFATSNSTPFLFRGLTFTNCASACVEGDSGGVAALDGPTFAAVTGDHISSFFSSRIVFITNGYTVTGGASVHWQSTYGGEIFIQPNKTVTCSGTPSFIYWSQSTRNGLQDWNSATFSGCGGVTTSIGRCQLDTGGGIDTFGGSSAYLPGNTAVCTATTPAWYN